jgi:hypothetical protein
MSSLKRFSFRYFLLAGAAAIAFAAAAPQAGAQISIRIGAGGPAPVCPYGYYDYAPYACAPYGYYGPNWFVGGTFIGAGPWFHGPRGFHGYVDNHFDPHHGYRGPMPHRGDHADRDFHSGARFHGNEMRDGRGHGGDRH